MAYYISSGVTSTGISLNYENMYVKSGGVANRTTVKSGGDMYISSGGVANRTTVKSGGDMYISSGGVAISTTVNDGGSMYIDCGGVANSTTVNDGGYMYIASGGTATNVVWTPCVGRVNAAAGACVTYASAYSGVYFGSSDQLLAHTQSMTGKVVSGSMYVMSNGVANRTTVKSGGDMYIYSGGVANSTTVNSGGDMYISSGGVANSTTVNSGGYMHISSGGVANSTTINDGGNMRISSGGTANSTTVNPGVDMEISSGGVANSTTANSGGSMYISSGGTATEIVENGGYVEVAYGANVTFASNTINGLTLSDARMTVHSNTVANSTTINNWGSMYIYSGGVANSTTINQYGSMRIGYGGVANSTTVNSSGCMYISSGGVANSTTIIDGWMFISSGGVANSTTINFSGYMEISSGGVANSTTINSGGDMHIGSGVVANSTTVNFGGSIRIGSGVVANSTTLNSGGYMTIDSGGVANSTTVNSGGDMYISSGGVANSTTINSGWMDIFSGGVANSTTVNSGGRMYISSGGVANSTTINSGNMYISSGGVHRGSLQIAGGATVSAYSGAKIDFTVADRTASDGYLINDLSRISGTPTYTITVSADQKAGEYKLAQGAANFTGMITIGNGTDEYGALTVNGDALFCNSRIYILKQVDGNLTLDIFRNVPENLRGSADGLSWDPAYGADGYLAQYRFDNMTAALNVYTSSTAVDTYNLPGKSNFWRVCVAGGDWTESLLVSGTKQPTQPLMMQSDADGDTDLFFARANGKWGESYAAEHQGIKDVWNGIGKKVQLTGKNKLEDVFVGSNDANILVLTDDANGDALFVDDIFSAFPDEIEAQARIAGINEIRAGAGDDVIDLTSQQFVYVGDGLTVFGGLGNDVIWANSGENCLFGDAGNDRIVGGSDNDIIVGGAGNDSMHGGGGSDTFCFGSDWGRDTIEQLADGSVTLWFESGSEDFWNAETLTYSDGVNKVTIKGVTADAVSLRFGDVETAIAGAFENAASEKIYEDQDKALIA